GASGVDVDVLLTGELHDLVHDLVGDRPQHEPVFLHPLVPREVQGLAEPDVGPGVATEHPTGRSNDVGVDHRDGNDGDLRGQPPPGYAGPPAVQAAAVGPGALRVDAEQLPVAEHPQPGRQRAGGGASTGAVDRHLASTGEEPTL